MPVLAILETKKTRLTRVQVRKLYRMLEENKDSRGQNIVRWGDDGSSFVVLEVSRGCSRCCKYCSGLKL